MENESGSACIESGGWGVIVKLLHSDIYSVQHVDREMTMVSNLCEEVVPQNVLQVGSVLGHLGQQAGDELLSLWRQGRGKGVASFPNTPVRLLQVGGFKRRSAQQHCIPAAGRRAVSEGAA